MKLLHLAKRLGADSFVAGRCCGAEATKGLKGRNTRCVRALKGCVGACFDPLTLFMVVLTTSRRWVSALLGGGAKCGSILRFGLGQDIGARVTAVRSRSDSLASQATHPFRCPVNQLENINYPTKRGVDVAGRMANQRNVIGAARTLSRAQALVPLTRTGSNWRNTQ
jgi:hypothetical protein